MPDEKLTNGSSVSRKLKLGIVGIGVGASEILPAMESAPQIQIVAGADVNPRVRQTFQSRYGATTYDSMEALCADPEVEAVWISTPNKFHAPHTITAARHGKHVVVEKPMAISLGEAEEMIAAAERNKIKLVCGHTQSFGPHIQTMKRILQSGRIGKLRAMHVSAYTDWMLRPRTAEELDIAQGGGIPYRQGPHQIDTLRLLGGGMVRSVRGTTGQWFEGRPIPGYYSAFLEFEDGTPATLMHNGYGYFLASELVPWGTNKTRYTYEERALIRRQLLDGTRDENRDKDEMRIGGSQEGAVFRNRGGRRAWVPNDLGLLIVSCDRGDIRQSQYGLYVYSDEGVEDVALPEEGWSRRAELEELYNAVALDKPIRHSGPWGMATLEVSLAIMQSARERREVFLSHQVPAPDL